MHVPALGALLGLMGHGALEQALFCVGILNPAGQVGMHHRPNLTSQTYQAEKWPVVQDQLTRAGVRLAELLNGELQ
jgi:hypothetical protein